MVEGESYDVLFKIIEDIKDLNLELSERNEIKVKICDLLHFLNDKKQIDPYKNFNVKIERLSNIDESQFLFFLIEYLSISRERPADIRKWAEIYRKEKNEQYKDLYTFLPDGKEHANQALHDFTSVIMCDPLLEKFGERTWANTTCLSVDTCYKITQHLFQNILELEFIKFDAFKKSLLKYRDQKPLSQFT